MRLSHALLSGALLSLSLALAQAAPEELLSDPLHQFQTIKPDPGAAETRIVPVDGQDFPQALEAKTIQNTAWPYDIQFQASVPVTVKNGDVVLAEFSIRTVAAIAESGEAKTQFCFEQKGGEYRKSVSCDVSVGHTWKKFQIPFRVLGVDGKDYAPNESQLSFRLGYRGQTIQIGGIRILNYGSDYDISKLPKTRLDYAGRDPQAPWRAEANKRIETLRKAPLTVQVVDASGNPIPSAQVSVTMKRHTFRFGSAVGLQFLTEQTPEAKRYRQFVFDHFNQITPEIDLKWDWWEREKEHRDQVLQALRDLRQNGIRIHGHCLIWPGATRVPPDIAAIFDKRKVLDEKIADHLNEILGQTRGLIEEWDAVNEPYAERDILNRYGDRLVGDWFTLVHKIDPAPILYLNDYPNFQNDGDDTPHKIDFEKRIKDLLATGVPIQGIGMQSHFGGSLCPPEAALKELDRFAALGLPIQITEFDIDAMDDDVKTDFTRDFLTVCFSHPAVIGFTCWGFWENRHWKPTAAMVRSDWSLTPWGQAWMDLVEKEWWTRASGTTDASGRYQVSGFLGEYIVKVTAGKKSATATIILQKNSPVATIKLER